MNVFKFTLKPYKTPADRLECPNCHRRHCFSPYISTNGEIIFPSYVGRCDHENSCGYHYTPKMYFHDHPEAGKNLKYGTSMTKQVQSTVSSPKVELYYFSSDLMRQTESHYQQNNFFLFLEKMFGNDTALLLMRRYHAGTTKHWKGGTVFWQVDINGNIRDGKIIFYDAVTGHRSQDFQHHITNVHSKMRIHKERIMQCFFGEHLLSEDKDKPIAIVESEKSAIICSFYLPLYTWIASGGKDGMFNKANLDIFKNRTVIFFPDLGQNKKWLHKATELKALGIKTICYNYLEEHASEEERKAGLDIADFLLQENPHEAVLHNIMRENTAICTLIKNLDLEIVLEKVVTLSGFPRREFG